MNHEISPCFWFDKNGKEAAKFYCSLFPNSEIIADAGVMVVFKLANQRFLALNGGPFFKMNHSISLFTICETEAETEDIWEKLSEGGKVLMPLNNYPWSEKYGWIQDKYGLSWQITLGKVADFGQKITPALMFTKEQFGRAEEAIGFYSEIFPKSETHLISRYDESDKVHAGKINHAQFSLAGQKFIVMDSGLEQEFTFSEGISIVLTCDTQDEIDHYWNHLTAGGQEGNCGWLKDKFGVSWQVVPSILSELMTDPEKASRVQAAFMKMKKFDIAALEKA